MEHLLTRIRVDPAGELGLQLFNLRNFHEPFAFLAPLAFPIVFRRYGNARATLECAWRCWKLAAGAKNLFQAPLEDYFELDIEEVRRRLGIAPLV
jgi:ubiquinone biosynthesis protein Coq4